jgi:hypothetical protein
MEPLHCTRVPLDAIPTLHNESSHTPESILFEVKMCTPLCDESFCVGQNEDTEGRRVHLYAHLIYCMMSIINIPKSTPPFHPYRVRVVYFR